MSPGTSYSLLTGRLSAPINPSALRRDAGAGRCECLASASWQVGPTGRHWLDPARGKGLSFWSWCFYSFFSHMQPAAVFPGRRASAQQLAFCSPAQPQLRDLLQRSADRPGRTMRAGFQPWLGEGSSQLFHLCMLFSALEVVATYSWTSPKDLKFSTSPLST